MKCDRCGKDVDPVYPHTCTPLALKLADQLLYSAVIDHHEAAAELRRLYEEVEGTTQRNRDIYKQLDQAEAEIDRLYAENEALREALEMAVRQNDHDMLMTGEELRQARAALTGGKT